MFNRALGSLIFAGRIFGYDLDSSITPDEYDLIPCPSSKKLQLAERYMEN
jgi:hypothetical protein